MVRWMGRLSGAMFALALILFIVDIVLVSEFEPGFNNQFSGDESDSPSELELTQGFSQSVYVLEGSPVPTIRIENSSGVDVFDPERENSGLATEGYEYLGGFQNDIGETYTIFIEGEGEVYVQGGALRNEITDGTNRGGSLRILLNSYDYWKFGSTKVWPALFLASVITLVVARVQDDEDPETAGHDNVDNQRPETQEIECPTCDTTLEVEGQGSLEIECPGCNTGLEVEF